MGNLLETRNEDGKKLLAYQYSSLKEIDDVILQLLNEADMEGFIKSSLDKSVGSVNYDVTGYAAFSDIEPVKLPKNTLLALLNSLYRLLEYLEDSFIDIEYVLFDENYVFVNPESKQMYVIVLPCQAALDSQATLADCLERILASFGGDYLTGVDTSKFMTKIQKGIRSLENFQEILQLLERNGQGADDGPEEDWMILRSGMGEENPGENKTDDISVMDLKLDDFLREEENKSDEDVELGDIKSVDADNEKTGFGGLNFKKATDFFSAVLAGKAVDTSVDLFSEEEKDVDEALDMDQNQNLQEPEIDIQLEEEESRIESEAEIREVLRAEVRDEVREELRGEVEAEIREALLAEIKAEVREALRPEVEAEVRRALRAEVESEVRKALRAEVKEEVREELRSEVKEEVEAAIRSEVIDDVYKKVKMELQQETSEEIAEEIAEEIPEETAPVRSERKIPYLIRKKTGQIIRLNRDTFIIGKMNTCCDYTIKDNSSISRLHAVIKYRDKTDDYFIADCNSTNHTYLNGCRIPEDQPVTLEDRMHIHLATEEFIFRI